MRPRPSHRRGWATVAALAFGGLTSAFMFTLVVPLQGELPELLSTSRENSSWVVTVTLLVSAVVTPIAGRLGDMYGKRRVVLMLLVVLIIGSVIAALSSSVAGMIVGRGLQGAAMGIMPLGIAIMRDVLPPARLGTAVALMSATMGVGGALGMPLAAYIAQMFDWHQLFWVAAGLGLIVMLLIWLWVPEDTLVSGGRLDVPGAFGLAVGLTGILLFVSRGAEWGWGSPAALTAIGVGIATLLAWGFYERRITPHPLVDLRIVVRPAVLITNLASVGMGFAMFSSNVVFPQMLEIPRETGVGFGLTMTQAAFAIMPSGLIMMLVSPLSGFLVRSIGPRLLFTVGAAATTCSYAFVLLWSSEVWHIVVANAFVGVGIAFSFAAMPIIIMGAVPANETGVSNGLNSLFRSVGTSSAAAVMGGVLAALSVETDGRVVPTAEAFEMSFVIAIAAGVVATALTLLIPRSTPPEARPALPSS